MRVPFQNWVMAAVASVAFTGGLLSGLQFAGAIAGGLYVVGMGLIVVTLIGAFIADAGQQREYAEQERRKLRTYEILDRRLSASIIKLAPSPSPSKEAAE